MEDGLIGAFDLRGRGVVYDVCGEKGDAEPSGTSKKQGERGVTMPWGFGCLNNVVQAQQRAHRLGWHQPMDHRRSLFEA